MKPTTPGTTWRATPSEDTTVGELIRAVDQLDLEVRSMAGEVYLEQMFHGEQPPDIETIARVMYGEKNDAVLVTETGVQRTLDADPIEEIPVG